MTAHIILDALIVAVIVYLCDRFLPLKGRIARPAVIGLLAALAIVLVPRVLP